MPDLNDIFAEYEAEQVANTAKEMAAEKAAWDALSPEQQAAITAERQAKCDALWAGSDENEEDFDGDDEEE